MTAIQTLFSNLLGTFGAYAPRLLWVLLVLIVGSIILKLVKKLLSKWLSFLPCAKIGNYVETWVIVLIKVAIGLTILTTLWLSSFAATLLSVLTSVLWGIILIWFWSNRAGFTCGWRTGKLNAITGICCGDKEGCDKGKWGCPDGKCPGFTKKPLTKTTRIKKKK